MKLYIASFEGKKIEIEAENSTEALKKAVTLFGKHSKARMVGLKLVQEKINRNYKSLSPALYAGATLANMKNKVFYIYKNAANYFKLTDYVLENPEWEKTHSVHPYEKSEMTNKEEGNMI